MSSFVWNQRQYSFSFALFRVILAVSLLVKTLLLLPYLEDLYNHSEFQYVANMHWIRQNIFPIYCAFLSILLLFLFGIAKHFSAWLIFLFYTLLYYVQLPQNNWGDDILLQSLLFFVAVDAYEHLTINQSKGKKNDTIHSFATWMLKIHLIYIYFSNAIYKVFQPDWQSGNAMEYFLQSSTVLDAWQLVPFLLQNGMPAAITYTVLIYQLFFLGIIFIPKNFRIFFVLIGVLMHLIMGFILGLWLFQITMILHLFLFVKNQEWQVIFGRNVISLPQSN